MKKILDLSVALLLLFSIANYTIGSEEYSQSPLADSYSGNSSSSSYPIGTNPNPETYPISTPPGSGGYPGGPYNYQTIPE